MPRSLRDQRRLSARGDHAALFSQHRFDALQNSVHQVREAIEKSRLHRLRRIRPDNFARIANLHAPEPRRPRKERLGGNPDPRRQRPAEVFAVFGNHVEVDRRPKIHHDARPAVLGERRDAVDDPVRAHLLRIIVVHRHSRADAGLDEERLGVKVLFGHARQRGVQRRHHRTDDHAANFVRIEIRDGKKIARQNTVLVHGLIPRRGQPPIGDQLGAAKDS